jgi:hypothetical protein
MTRHRFVFATAQGRFHLADATAKVDCSTAWQDGRERLIVGAGVVAVGTAESFAHVVVTVRISDGQPPAEGTERWAFAEECELEISSERLRVEPCTSAGRGSCTPIAVPRGRYGVRIRCDRGADAPVLPGGVETYLIDLWPLQAPGHPEVAS